MEWEEDGFGSGWMAVRGIVAMLEKVRGKNMSLEEILNQDLSSKGMGFPRKSWKRTY